MPALGELTTEDIRKAAVASSSFRSYTEFVHDWTPREHQDTWWRALQALADGKLTTGLWVNGIPQTPVEERRPTNKLMIVAPPESGKSDSANEWAEWMIGRSLKMGHVPQCGIVAYGDDPATDRSVAIRDMIAQSPRYTLVFNDGKRPLARPDKNKGWSAHEWFLEREDPGKKDCTLRAAGINGGIWAYRFPTLILLDDPHDYRTITSQAQKDDVWRTWTTTIRSRARENTPILLICTRWADDDLAGRLMEVEGDWCVVRTTALIPEDPEEGEQVTYWPPEEISPGQWLGISTEGLLNYQRTMGEDFPTQFMASPPYVRGDLFRWWHYGPEPYPQDVDRVYQFWDTASSETKRADYNVMGEFLKLKNGRSYLRRVVREKMETPRLLTTIVEEFARATREYGESGVVVIVENKHTGKAVADILRPTINIMPWDIPKMDLRDRAKLCSVNFQTGHVFLPEGWAGWRDTYERELRAFPRTQYKDQVAMTCLALEYMYPVGARGRPAPLTEYVWSR